jgi:Fur family transcriptional regulator, ferric uptake regulator
MKNPHSAIERACIARGMRMTGQRRIIAKVIEEAKDHPDAELLYQRAAGLDSHISLSTVYRTLKMMEEANIITRLDLKDGRARFERAPKQHHDHLIDMATGKVIEFHDPEIERLQEMVARKLGYRLMDHNLELYGIKLEPDD